MPLDRGAGLGGAARREGLDLGMTGAVQFATPLLRLTRQQYAVIVAHCYDGLSRRGVRAARRSVAPAASRPGASPTRRRAATPTRRPARTRSTPRDMLRVIARRRGARRRDRRRLALAHPHRRLPVADRRAPGGRPRVDLRDRLPPRRRPRAARLPHPRRRHRRNPHRPRVLTRAPPPGIARRTRPRPHHVRAPRPTPRAPATAPRPAPRGRAPRPAPAAPGLLGLGLSRPPRRTQTMGSVVLPLPTRDRARDLSKRAVVTPLQCSGSDTEPLPPGVEEVVSAVVVVVVHRSAHVRVAPVELEPHTYLWPRRIEDVAAPVEEHLVFERGVAEGRNPWRVAATSASHSLRDRASSGWRSSRIRNTTAQPGRFECLSSFARRRSFSGFTSPRTIALSTIAIPRPRETRWTESSKARTGERVRRPSTTTISYSRQIPCRMATGRPVRLRGTNTDGRAGGSARSCRAADAQRTRDSPAREELDGETVLPIRGRADTEIGRRLERNGGRAPLHESTEPPSRHARLLGLRGREVAPLAAPSSDALQFLVRILDLRHGFPVVDVNQSGGRTVCGALILQGNGRLDKRCALPGLGLSRMS